MNVFTCSPVVVIAAMEFPPTSRKLSEVKNMNVFEEDVVTELSSFIAFRVALETTKLKIVEKNEVLTVLP